MYIMLQSWDEDFCDSNSRRGLDHLTDVSKCGSTYFSCDGLLYNLCFPLGFCSCTGIDVVLVGFEQILVRLKSKTRG